MSTFSVLPFTRRAVLGLGFALALPSLSLAQEPVTTGPNGEPASPAGSVAISDGDVEKLKAGSYTAAFAWHELYDWSSAVARGAKEEFARLGIEVVAETNASFDAARQTGDVETIMALKPSILISLPVDAEAGPATYGKVAAAGTRLVFIDNAAGGLVQGSDYVTTVTSDRAIIGARTAEAMDAALSGSGKIGYIFHDANFQVTNQRDQAFVWNIENRFSGLEIVAMAGMADPARIEDIANAMLTQNPEITGIYVPWAEPALGVLAVLRQLGRDDVKIVSIDLNEPAALDMAKGGAVSALIADEAYAIGVTAARAAALSLLDQKVDPLLAVGAGIVNKDNLADGWRASLNAEPPQSVLDALK
jgi:ribose transport system substrate-binding protein